MTEVGKSKELAKASKELERANNKVEQYGGYLERDITHGRDTGRSRINLKYANKDCEKAKEKINKLK